MPSSSVARALPLILIILLSGFFVLPGSAGPEPAPSHLVRFEEVVTDPKQDRNSNGRITSIDEMIVLASQVDHPVDVTGWRLYMQDTTPEEQFLDGVLAPRERLVIVNPRGSINNDIHLWLFDQDGDLVDRVHLGTDVPNGRSTSLLDEAVHLLGPWAGMKAPATNGLGLGPFWVESIVMAKDDATSVPLQAGWLPAGPASLQIRIHLAPGHEGTPILLVGQRSYSLEPGLDGTFVADGVVLEGTPAMLGVRVGDTTLTTWPNGSPLRFPVDRAPPHIEAPHEVVLNATRHVHWAPQVVDDESGVGELVAFAKTTTGSWRLPDCALPRDAPATCPLPQNVTALVLHASDLVGNVAEATLELLTVTAPPSMPQSFTFEIGVPPTIYWPPFDEVLTSLRIETADDLGGNWNRSTITLTATATAFTDEEWAAGSPRAYRLVATGRGGATAMGPWVALPEDAVPVAYALSGLELVVGHLLEDKDALVKASFDRALRHAPALVLDVESPRPYRLVVNGSMSPDGRMVSWLASADGFPRSGVGYWSFGGGAGQDGAPIATLREPVTWDLEPPRIDVAGLVDGWIRSDRHVVMVSARDLGPTSPTITVHAEAAGLSEHPGRVDVLLRGEGAHHVQVVAVDAAGNQAETHFTVLLDGTAPQVVLEEVPDVWSDAQPIVLLCTDAGSGIDPASFMIEVHSSNGTHRPNVTWNGTRAVLVPEAPVVGPFELHVGLADVAGNQVFGLLGVRLSAPGLPVQVVLNGTVGSGEAKTGDPNASSPAMTMGGLAGPVVAEPGSSWRDLTVPMPSMRGAEGEASTTAWSWLAGLIGAGVVGLGTAVRRRTKIRARKEAEHDGVSATGSEEAGGSVIADPRGAPDVDVVWDRAG